MPKTVTPVGDANQTKVEQITFHDEDKGFITTIVGESDPTTHHGRTDTADIARFLERPLLIDTHTWLEGSFFAHTYDPWTLFLTNPLVANKLKNFGGFRATLNIRVSISSSPFYAGLGMVIYNALPDSTITVPIVIAGDAHIVSHSQRPKIIISPQDNMGGQLTMPFIYPYNYCPINSSLFSKMPGLSDLGLINYRSTTVLRNFNSVALGGVSVTAYAWLTDLELTMNTVNVTVQGGKVKFRKRPTAAKGRRAKLMSMTNTEDEYGDSPVSGVASAVASAAGKLTNIPVIGPYMRATEMGAGYLSSIASWFGFTNVPVIADSMPYLPTPFQNLSSSEISHPITRLSLDPKNELTVDSRVCGLDGTDELAIASIVGREAYITKFTWSDSDAAGSDLWHTMVTPQMFRIDGLTFYTTPMMHLAQMFEYWTGDIEFRFVVQATKFHMGRLRIQFEPADTSLLTTDSQLVNSTQVFDIGDTKDFTVRVPYSQLKHWLQTGTTEGVEGNTTIFSSSAGSLDTAFWQAKYNGFLSVFVQNKLSGPSASNTLDVSVFVKGCDNLAFANPRDINNSVSYSTQVQGGMECKDECDMEPESTSSVSLGETDEVTKVSYGVYMGETCLSVRQLMHRDTFYTSIGPAAGATSNKRIDVLLFQSMFPKVVGSWTNAMHETLVGNKYNYVGYSALSWMAPCYIGQRGSVNWTVNSLGAKSQSMTIARASGVRNTNALALSVQATVNGSDSENAFYKTSAGVDNILGGMGMALTSQETNAGLSANVPYFSSARFTYTAPNQIQATGGSGDEDHLGANQNMQIRVGYMPAAQGKIATNNATDIYVSAGHDYNLVYYKNSPVLHLIAGQNLPAPAS